mmetsp:Transcript_26446/g.48404  ORF Transcript_26446/g.48404 Transcript_26446/m.48404 type:complete len:349 (-) Transcript_26446:118-1164(-)
MQRSTPLRLWNLQNYRHSKQQNPLADLLLHLRLPPQLLPQLLPRVQLKSCCWSYRWTQRHRRQPRQAQQSQLLALQAELAEPHWQRQAYHQMRSALCLDLPHHPWVPPPCPPPPHWHCCYPPPPFSQEPLHQHRRHRLCCPLLHCCYHPHCHRYCCHHQIHPYPPASSHLSVQASAASHAFQACLACLACLGGPVACQACRACHACHVASEAYPAFLAEVEEPQAFHELEAWVAFQASAVDPVEASLASLATVPSASFHVQPCQAAAREEEEVSCLALVAGIFCQRHAAAASIGMLRQGPASSKFPTSCAPNSVASWTIRSSSTYGVHRLRSLNDRVVCVPLMRNAYL